MEISQQKQLLVNGLKNMYWAEKYFLKILPKLEKAAGTRYLKACFKGHLNATKEHVSRLDQVFQLLNGKARGRKCQEIFAVILETKEVIHSTQKDTLLRDLGLITVAQKMEYYEINKYNDLIRTSKELGEDKIVALLEEILVEEKEAEETFEAVKEDTLNDEIFKPAVEELEFEEFENA